MDDDRRPVLPDLRRHLVLEERADDQARICELDRLTHRLWAHRQLHADVVTRPAKFQPGALGEAVERGRKQKDLHRCHAR
jgi:hypothetical protein